MARRGSSKKAPPDIGLHMECVEEDLEPSQLAYYSKAEKEYNDVQNKLDNYVKKMKAEVVEKGENCMVLQINATPASVSLASSPQITTTSGKTTRQTSQNYQQVVGQGILTRSTSNSTGSTYLVMDPRLGFMVSQVQPPAVSTEQTALTPTQKTGASTRGRPASTSSVMVTTRAKSGLKKQSTVSEDVITPPLTRTRDKSKNQTGSPQTSPQVIQQQVFSSGSSTPNSYKIKVNAKPLLAPAKPSESNALGGLSAGTKIPWKPTDETNKNNPDSKEVVFNKFTAKIFPSLVVVARPYLKVKYIPQTTIATERSALDSTVKGVLMYTPAKFIEWLIQQGLIRSDQFCQTHLNNDLSPVKLKLGMYSDVSKFPYSGGYVWISDCCPSQFVSVFSGSIFEGAPHPPITLLKLIYHWACQTNIQNVVQWVKIDNLYLKNFYTNMRAICTQTVHEKYKKMGGPRKKIEVGVISLGTTSQDGNRRQVKVEVLGVMDQESKLVRLRAVEPLSEERSFKRRFVKILEPLEEWVHKESTILTDFTVAKAALDSLGFRTVYQVTNDSKYSNQNIMDYLRRIVPRMFQNTLSLLSRQIIQQFLDELVWREMWGPIPSQAFFSIVSHIAEITKLDVSENFLSRLNKVASNPFKRWHYAAWKPVTGNTRAGAKAQQRPSTSSSQDSISEISIETSTVTKGIRTRKRAAEQSLSETSPSPVSGKKMAKISAKEKPKKEEKVVKKDKEVDKLPEDVIKFINEGEQIPLEKYYYGSKSGDKVLEHPCIKPFNVKCSVCYKRFKDNIILMKHMILHCQIEPPLIINLKKVYQCDYCFIGFNAAIALRTHLEEIHSVVNGKLESNLLCHICEEKFKSRHELIYHMHRTHVELEMPYECGVCQFRTSVYKVFVDHFVQAHRGEEHVFCPYCLKVVTFSYKGEVITSNVLFYISHLEKHQRLSLIKDCGRCQLSFIHKGILDQHLDADHESCKGEPGVESLKHLPTGINMPEPGCLIKPATATKTQKSPKMKNLYVVNKFKALEVNGIEDDMACLECEGSLMRSDHFTGIYNCLKCRFSSCCEKAVVEHQTIFHESSAPLFTMGRPIVMPQEMYCVCGFSSTSGNRTAKHLAICERKSAYASKEAAAAAVVRHGKIKSEEEKNKHGEGQNVLNMLGLVRKSPETGNDLVKTEVEDLEMETEKSGEFKLPKEEVRGQKEKEPQYTRKSKQEKLKKNTEKEKKKEDTNEEKEEKTIIEEDKNDESSQLITVQDTLKKDLEISDIPMEITEDIKEEDEDFDEDVDNEKAEQDFAESQQAEEDGNQEPSETTKKTPEKKEENDAESENANENITTTETTNENQEQDVEDGKMEIDRESPEIEETEMEVDEPVSTSEELETVREAAPKMDKKDVVEQEKSKEEVKDEGEEKPEEKEKEVQEKEKTEEKPGNTNEKAEEG